MHLDLGTTGPGPAAPPGGINPGINITIGDIGSKTPCEVDRTRAAAPHAASPPQLHADAADAQPDARAAQPAQPDVGHTRDSDTGRPKTRPTTASRPLTRAGRPLTRPTPEAEARQMLPPSSKWVVKGPGKRGKDHVARGPEGRNPGALRKLREWRQRQRLRTQRAGASTACHSHDDDGATEETPYAGGHADEAAAEAPAHSTDVTTAADGADGAQIPVKAEPEPDSPEEEQPQEQDDSEPSQEEQDEYPESWNAWDAATWDADAAYAADQVEVKVEQPD